MKYQNYYADLGIERTATPAQIKGAYRKLAHKFHPDVSKDPEGETKFKKIAEAYQTLKDPKKRAAYDQLGEHEPGKEFRPPPQWESQFSDTAYPGERPFDDIDLADLFAGLSGHRSQRGRTPSDLTLPGRDYDVTATISLEDVYRGTQVDLHLSLPEIDADGRLHETERTLRARIPKGAMAGQRLRLRGQGGKGINGGRNGDLYVTIALRPHALYRVHDRDLYLDLPLAPWECALGASIEVPTLGGPVRLKVPAGTLAGHKLRLPKRGLPTPQGDEGDLYAMVQIVMPVTLNEQELELLKSLSEVSRFNPRLHFNQENQHAA